MTSYRTTGLALLLGITVGALGVHVLHAQVTPPVYVISSVTVKNAEAYEKEYLQLSQKSIKSHGGKTITATSRITALEGDKPDRISINRFASLEQAQNWYRSDDYKKAREIGDKYATFTIFAVDKIKK